VDNKDKIIDVLLSYFIVNCYKIW